MKIAIVSVASAGTMIAAVPPTRIPVMTTHLRAFLTSLSDSRRSLNHAVMMPAGATSG